MFSNPLIGLKSSASQTMMTIAPYSTQQVVARKILTNFIAPVFTPRPNRAWKQHNTSKLGPFHNYLSLPNYHLLNNIPAPRRLLWLSGTPNNILTHNSESLEATSHSHLDGSQHRGDYTLGVITPTGITILNTTQQITTAHQDKKGLWPSPGRGHWDNLSRSSMGWVCLPWTYSNRINQINRINIWSHSG